MDGLGKVYLTGAGPGAADLLTVRAARVLGQAEVVFHDALVSAEVLNLCPAGCSVVAVGKKGGVPSRLRQEQIHQHLREAAGRCRTVVRLKGGDPCVFGRGGEELEYLAAHGIPWEVIPGISAGVGGLSALGLPLTHRELSSSVTLFTGSQALSGSFPGLAGSRPPAEQTLVFYMGFQHVEAITRDLLRQGLAPSTYALCASRLTWPDQRLLTAPLERIGAEVADAGLQTPALLVVGDVVDFWRRLHQAGKGEQP
jgi:uroporphyrin-III C-methyltransferase